MIKVKATKIKSRRFGKSVTRAADGSLIKNTVMNIADGEFETLDCEWSNFGKLIESFEPNSAAAWGVCQKIDISGHQISSGRIVTDLMELSLEDQGDDSHYISRTRRNFCWHRPPCDTYNVLFIDIDDIEDGDVEGAIERVLEAWPELTKLESGFWVRPSSGALVYDEETGDQITGISGVHAYFAIPPSIPMDRVIRYLELQGVDSGVTRYEAVTTGSGLVRVVRKSIIDLSVFQPERCDFLGGAACGTGLIQKLPPAEWYPKQDTSGVAANFRLSKSEVDRLSGLLKKSQMQAKGQATRENAKIDSSFGLSSAAISGVLPGMAEIQFHDGTRAQVWELIFYPEKFHGKYCADPLHPEKGTQKAMFYYNEGNRRENRFVISSFVKGGTVYQLKTDIDGVMALLSREGEDTVREKLKDSDKNNGTTGWTAEFSQLDPISELPEVLDFLSSKKIGNRTTIKMKVGSDKSNELKLTNRDKLEMVNKRFCYSTIKGKAVYIEERDDEIILRDDNSFFAELGDWPKFETVQANGSVKSTNVGKIWKEWEGRRRVDEIRFAPYRNEREFIERGRTVLNRFKGFKMVPPTKECIGCRASECGGRGCIQYFMDEVRQGGSGICPVSVSTGSNWTYWCQTIYGAVVRKNLDHFKWVVDWFADITQHPGGHPDADGNFGSRGGERSGASLCIRGDQGTGKNSVIDPVMDILGPYSLGVTEMDRLTARFNDYLEDQLLVFCNEAVFAGSRQQANKLKDMITGNSIQIEAKGLKTFNAVNFMRFVIATNSDWAVPAEENERRYTVFDISDKYRKDQKWFGKVKAAREPELMRWLLDLEITSDLRMGLETEALENQKDLGRDDVDSFFIEILDALWEENGAGKIIPHTLIDEVYQASFASRRNAYDNVVVFKRKLRSRLKGLGFEIASKVWHEGRTVNGFRFPNRDLAFKKMPFLEREWSLTQISKGEGEGEGDNNA